MIKTVNDLLPELCEAFPTVPPKDIKMIVEFGFRALYYYNLRGCDTIVSSTKHKFWFYIGELRRDSMKHFNYYKRMLRRKLRILYSRSKVEWDGYYYIGLSEDEYNEFITPRKGRKRKYYSYNNKCALKIYDESKLYYSWCKAIIKFPSRIDLGYTFYKKELTIESPEIVMVREKPDTFQDVLISNNNYELIK